MVPGESYNVTINLIYGEKIKEELQVGKMFTLIYGKQVLAEGNILKVKVILEENAKIELKRLHDVLEKLKDRKK